MGKGNRNKLRRENDNLVNADTKVKAAKKKTNGVPLWAGNMVLGAIALMLVVVILVTTISSSGIVLRLTKYASSNSYQLTGSQMTYIFRTLYNNFAEQYSSYLSYILDTSKSLKDQDSIYEDENGKKLTAGKEETFVSGKTVTARLQNFDVENYGEAAVNGSVFIELQDGTVIESTTCTFTLRAMMESIAASAETLTDTQLSAVKAFVARFSGATANWNIDSLR